MSLFAPVRSGRATAELPRRVCYDRDISKRRLRQQTDSQEKAMHPGGVQGEVNA
jgi:hypothetical protein